MVGAALMESSSMEVRRVPPGKCRIFCDWWSEMHFGAMDGLGVEPEKWWRARQPHRLQDVYGGWRPRPELHTLSPSPLGMGGRFRIFATVFGGARWMSFSKNRDCRVSPV